MGESRSQKNTRQDALSKEITKNIFQNLFIYFYSKKNWCQFKKMLIKSFASGVSYYNDSVSSVENVVTFIRDKEGLPLDISLRCELNGKLLPPGTTFDPDLIDNCGCVSVIVAGGLPGGKGGFGSLLRSIGAQIEKTTNHEAMRDLSGRRQRDVNNEERLKKYVAGAAEREKEARERKEEKLEKLRRLAEGENKDKRGFNDPFYDKVRSETEEKVHDAMEAALASTSTVVASNSNNNLKRKIETGSQEVAKKKPKGGLWIGEGLEDLDDSDLSDTDEEEEKEEATK